MCDRDQEPDYLGCEASTSSSLTSSAELSLSSNTELGDGESNPEVSELRVVSMLDYLKHLKHQHFPEKERLLQTLRKVRSDQKV